MGEAFASRSPLLVIATDVPTSVRRAGRLARRRCTRRPTRRGCSSPVVKAALRAPKGTDLGRAVAEAAAAARAAPARPGLPRDPHRPAPGRGARAARRARRSRAGAPPPRPVRARRRAHGPLAQPADLGRRRRRGRRRGRGDRRAGRAAGGAGAHHLLRPRPAATRTTRATWACRRTSPQAGALWDEADLVIAIGSDLDGMMTQNWEQPQPPHLLAVNVDAEDASKNYLPDLVLETDAARRHRGAGPPRRAARRPRRAAHAAGAAARARCAPASSESDPEALGFLDASTARCRRRPWWSATCASRATGSARCAVRPAPRRLLYPLGWGTLGCAFPQALGAALAVRCPGGQRLRRRRLPVRLRRAGGGGPGGDPGDRRRGRRRRLRHAPLRPGAARRPAPRAWTCARPDFEALARSFGVRAETVDGLGEAFEAKLQHHASLREPTLLVAHAALRPAAERVAALVPAVSVSAQPGHRAALLDWLACAAGGRDEPAARAARGAGMATLERVAAAGDGRARARLRRHLRARPGPPERRRSPRRRW